MVFLVTLIACPVNSAFGRDIDHYSSYYLSPSDAPAKDGSIRVTFFGTTMLLFDDGETQFLIDGFITRTSLRQLFLKRSVRTDTALVDAALARGKVGKPKVLFVAHSHYDHALDIAYIAQKTNAQIYGSESTLNIGRGGGVPESQMTLLDLKQPTKVGQFTITVLPSKHSPPTRGLNDDLGIVISEPLKQPARPGAYTEGGSFDFVIKHGDHIILVKPSANFVEGALDNVRAEVLFLATATLGKQDQSFKDAFYNQTVGKVRPKLVIPVHWDSFFLPLNDHLEFLESNESDGFDFLIGRLSADHIQFGIMQGFQSIVLFK